MDVLETGTFEISTSTNDFLTEYQQFIAKEELLRWARMALERIQRSGVPYVTCFYPVEKRDDKLILKGFCAVALWSMCEVNEALFCDDDLTSFDYIANSYGREFELEETTWLGEEQVYIYRRTK